MAVLNEQDGLQPVSPVRKLRLKSRTNWLHKLVRREPAVKRKHVPGLIVLIGEYLSSNREVIYAGLAHNATVYSQIKLPDLTWGCGYRNIQQVFSALRAQDPFAYKQSFKSTSLPTIKEIQGSIEAAWAQGFDEEGAAQLKWKLTGTRKWIGTTEAYALLTSCGYNCTILQFSGADRAQKILDYCEQYFDLKTDARSTRIVYCHRPPLYFQHQGHSRTIIGALRTKGGIELLVFDPAKRLSRALRVASPRNLTASNFSIFRLPSADLKHKQYQLLSFSAETLSEAQQAQRKIIRPRDM